MQTRIRVTLKAIAVAVLTTCTVSAAGYELWAAGFLANNGGQAIARYSTKDGAFLGYFMHPTSGVGRVTNPGNGIIHKVETDGKRIYVAYQPAQQQHRVARYDYSGNHANLEMFTLAGGAWYGGGYHYPIKGMTFSDAHAFLLAAVWSTKEPELAAGTYLFRLNRDGTIAGTQPPTTPSNYSLGAQFSPAPKMAYINEAIDMERDSAGNFYALTASPLGVYRFTSDGQYYGPAGVGDTNIFIKPSVSVSDMVIDSQDRLYLSRSSGGVTVSVVMRYHADGTPAPSPGKSDDVFTAWVTYYKGVVYARSMAVSPVDGYLYVCNAYSTYNEINRFYTDGPNEGKIVEQGGFANLGGASAPLSKPELGLLFVPVPARGTTVLVK